MEVSQIVWLALVVVFVVAEAATAALVSMWFCAGAIAALVVALFWPGAIPAQIVTFLVVSALALAALRPLARKLVGNRRTPTNADASIGKTAQVVSEVQPGRFGRVKLEGLEWAAQSDAVLPVGSWCRVDAIEGVKLVVSPVNGPAEEAVTPTSEAISDTEDG